MAKKKHPLSEFLEKNTQIWIGVILVIFIVFVFFPMIFVVVPAGHVGVIDTLGKVSDKTLAPGFHLKNPLSQIIRFSTKTQQTTISADAPSQEGLIVGIDVSLLYHVDANMVPNIYKTIGIDYNDVVIQPEFRSIVRQVTSSYSAEALYTSQRGEMAEKLGTVLAEILKKRGIIVEATPLRNVKLPKRLKDAIEEKLRAEQESKRMQFVLRREKQEAERKRLEARGISDFQHIVSQGISGQLLQWKGIEATEKLADSKNSKVVIIGSGKNGLPIILNNGS